MDSALGGAPEGRRGEMTICRRVVSGGGTSRRGACSSSGRPAVRSVSSRPRRRRVGSIARAPTLRVDPNTVRPEVLACCRGSARPSSARSWRREGDRALPFARRHGSARPRVGPATVAALRPYLEFDPAERPAPPPSWQGEGGDGKPLAAWSLGVECRGAVPAPARGDLRCDSGLLTVAPPQDGAITRAPTLQVDPRHRPSRSPGRPAEDRPGPCPRDRGGETEGAVPLARRPGSARPTDRPGHNHSSPTLSQVRTRGTAGAAHFCARIAGPSRHTP